MHEGDGMALRFFTIPVNDAAAFEQELNGFLARHRVVSIDRRLIDQGVGSGPPMWSWIGEASAAGDSEFASSSERSGWDFWASRLCNGAWPPWLHFRRRPARRAGHFAALRYNSIWWTIRRGSNRVKRGGGWDNDAANCRTANRNTNDPTNRTTNNGFRLALNSPGRAIPRPEVPDGTNRLSGWSDASSPSENSSWARAVLVAGRMTVSNAPRGLFTPRHDRNDDRIRCATPRTSASGPSTALIGGGQAVKWLLRSFDDFLDAGNNRRRRKHRAGSAIAGTTAVTGSMNPRLSKTSARPLESQVQALSLSAVAISEMIGLQSEADLVAIWWRNAEENRNGFRRRCFWLPAK
jgi:hypothetical protein